MTTIILWSFTLDVRNIEIPKVSFLFLGLAAVIFFQYIYGIIPYPEQMILAVSYLIWAALLVIVGRCLCTHFELQFLCRIFAIGFLVGGVLNTIAALIQVFVISGNGPKLLLSFVNPLLESAMGRAYGNIGQSNHFVTYISISIASVSYLYLSNHIHPIVTALFIALLLTGTFLSGSRSFWMYLIFLILLGQLMVGDAVSRRIRGIALWIICVIVVLGVAQYFFHDYLPDGVARITSLNINELFSRRLQLLHHSWLMFMSAPLLGVGFGSFAYSMYQQVLVIPVEYKYELDVNAHNLVFHLLAVTGLCGLMIVIIPLLAWIRDIYKEDRSLERWWLCSILGIVFLHSMIEYPLWYSYFLGLVALLIGMLGGKCFRLNINEWMTWKPSNLYIKSIKSLVVFFLFLAMYELLIYARDYAAIESIIYVNSASKLDDSTNKYILNVVNDNGRLRRFVEFARPSSVVPITASVSEKLELSQRVIRFSPDAEATYRHSVLLAGAGFSDKALNNLQKAMIVYPDRSGVYKARMALLAQQDPKKYKPLADMLNKK